MGTFPNPATQFKSGEQQVLLARRAGQANKNNPNQIIAAKIREMKKKAAAGKISEKEVEWFMERLNNPQANIAAIKQDLDEIKALCKTPNQKIILAQTEVQVHKAQFGEKHQNLNMNVNVTMEEFERRLVGDPLGPDTDTNL